MVMSQVLKWRDTGSRLRQLIDSFRVKKEECVIQDEQDRPVAVVLPIERYESYQACQQQREEDFAIYIIDDKMKDYAPDFIDAQIEKAVAEVKTKVRTKRSKA